MEQLMEMSLLRRLRPDEDQTPPVAHNDPPPWIHRRQSRPVAGWLLGDRYLPPPPHPPPPLADEHSLCANRDSAETHLSVKSS